MTIAELPDNTNLKGLFVKAITGESGFWNYQNDTEVWLKAKFVNGAIIRIPIKNPDDILKWEVVG